MATAYFKIQLSVQPKGGTAELVVPKVLQDLEYDFVIIKDDATEGIVRIKQTQQKLKQIEKDKDCVRLDENKMDEIINSYPLPKIKKKYQLQTDETANEGPIIDTIQTVRSGYYLIDVPIILVRK